MPPLVDITGRTYGLLVVQIIAGRNRGGEALWTCTCACGQETTVRGSDLRNGVTGSCGCRKGNWIHGHARDGKQTPEHQAWENMLQRCYNDRCKDYPNYGGRGVRVCSRWHVFAHFFADLGLRPSTKHTLDRKNVNGNYTRRNCRWATRTEQNRNRRDTKLNATKVRQIRSMAMNGWTNQAIADKFNINVGYANAVIHRKWWRNA